jgi:hypothetical protein
MRKVEPIQGVNRDLAHGAAAAERAVRDSGTAVSKTSAALPRPNARRDIPSEVFTPGSPR